MLSKSGSSSERHNLAITQVTLRKKLRKISGTTKQSNGIAEFNAVVAEVKAITNDLPRPGWARAFGAKALKKPKAPMVRPRPRPGAF